MTTKKFEGFGKAPVFEKGKYLGVGNFLLEIKRCLFKDDGRTDGFIVEFTVLESDCVQNPVGSGASWFQRYKPTHISAPAIKEFIYACEGLTWGDNKKECEALDPLIDDMIEEIYFRGAYVGKKVRVTTRMKKTAEKKMDFTQHIWQPA